ncbi:hypothetical protein IEQ34_024698 [Dendrobium chrysotoxum]|uniref:Uncharacterized protein n=1 Tax=Dendrobium chrysotoxum TaxID=161865 RepID=A0AAV7FR98_DENCH|nr:hypothetical protein IEQ34_024698 [Dendrobium chrysotoxum]
MVEKRYAVASPVHQEGDDKIHYGARTDQRFEPLQTHRLAQNGEVLDRTGSSRPQWSFALTTFRCFTHAALLDGCRIVGWSLAQSISLACLPSQICSGIFSCKVKMEIQKGLELFEHDVFWGVGIHYVKVGSHRGCT